MTRSNDALNLALIEGQQGCNLLENARPTATQIAEAADHFNAAKRALSAALVLIEQGVYHVAPEPDAGTPLPGLGD